MSPHELRHTLATLCINRGIDIFVVSDQMGHSSIRVTERYVHLLKDVRKEADALLEELINDDCALQDSNSKKTDDKGLIVKDLIPKDLVINGIAIRDLIPESLVA